MSEHTIKIKQISKSGWHTILTIEEIQQVWLLVSNNPRITIREITKKTNIKRQRANCALKVLEKARYIKHTKGNTGRKVLIPLVNAVQP